jgi:hypothetical protein
MSSWHGAQLKHRDNFTFTFHKVYSSPNIIRAFTSRMKRWEGHVARMEKMRNAYKILVVKSEAKGPLETPGSRWENNIKMTLNN